MGIAADGASSYGRGIARGALQYANDQRSWEIHIALRRTFELSGEWPQCEGAIIAGAGEVLETLIRARSRHVVSCSGSADPSKGTVVSLDDRLAGAIAGEHLIECRLEQFSFYGLRPATHSRSRERGFVEALAKHGHDCTPCPILYEARGQDCTPDWGEFCDWLKSLPKPIGIMAVDDTAALDLAAACRHADIAVPEQVAIVGVNNDDLICESSSSPLSSVDCGFPMIGYAAARLLHRLMRGEQLSAQELCIRVPPLQVVRRLSTDMLAVDDPELSAAVRYIRDHASDPCSVRNVVRAVAIGRRDLERRFARKLGRTPGEEIVRIQMETAKRLLLLRELTLEDVAQRSGFSSASALIRAFHRLEGITPKAFRSKLPITAFN